MMILMLNGATNEDPYEPKKRLSPLTNCLWQKLLVNKTERLRRVKSDMARG